MLTNPSSVTERLEALEQENRLMKTRLAGANARSRVLSAFAGVPILAGLVLLQSRPANAQGHGGSPTDARLTALETRMTAAETVDTTQNGNIAAVQTQTQFISVSGTEMTITGANLNIVNGLGTTDQINGLGNLIVGYNELRSFPPDIRSGSHNLVLGIKNSYGSYGGIVSGKANLVSGPYSSILCGEQNEATAMFSSVTGGFGNRARADYSSVTGGNVNTANGTASSVSGGAGNSTTGSSASISGGVSLGMGTSGGWRAGSLSGTTVNGNFSSP